MKTKTSIRYFNNVPVRARWHSEESAWFYVASDLVKAFTSSSSPRKYWNALKTRHPELSTNCRQLKISSTDGKRYNTDCLSYEGIKQLISYMPKNNQKLFWDWISGMSSPLDEQSKLKAYELYDSDLLEEIEIGTINGLKQIHGFLFEGLYDFAGKIRDKNISKKGFSFANWMYFDEIFKEIESMPDKTADEIIDKYIELNIAHPFMEGNGRATRIWLDLLLKDRIGKCVDWQKIDKQSYLKAMEKSVIDSSNIKSLIKKALTDRINDRTVYLKGIDYSYYYEEI